MNYYFSAAVLVPFLVVRRGEGGHKESDTRERRRAKSRLSFSLLYLRVSRPRGFL